MVVTPYGGNTNKSTFIKVFEGLRGGDFLFNKRVILCAVQIANLMIRKS